MLTHGNLIANVTQSRVYLEDLADTWQVLLPNMPFIHIYGVTCGVLNACACGWTTIIMTRFSVRATIDYLSRYPVSIINSVPILFAGLIDHLEKDPSLSQSFDNLKLAGCGSAPLPENVFKKFFSLTGVELCQGYGLTESSPVVCSSPVKGIKKAGSVGIPYPGVEVKIVNPDDHSRIMDPGQPGDLLVKGPQVMKGYYNQAEETADALAEGYLHTGDIAFQDEDGYVFLIGRKKDMVISGGYNIYPAEIDDVILTNPHVSDTCTIGVPHPDRGEVLKSYVVPKPDSELSEQDVLDYCTHNLSKFKVPFYAEIRSSLPRDQVQKVCRVTLLNEHLNDESHQTGQSDWRIF
jgi:long-chain acyl-CoA synthetase